MLHVGRARHPGPGSVSGGSGRPWVEFVNGSWLMWHWIRVLNSW